MYLYLWAMIAHDSFCAPDEGSAGRNAGDDVLDGSKWEVIVLGAAEWSHSVSERI